MKPTWHEEARRLRSEGAKIKEIARHFGKTEGYVLRVCRGVACPIKHKSTGRPVEWTKEGDQFLRDFYNGVLSASHIGKRLGYSRNAIIGRAHRIGLARPA